MNQSAASSKKPGDIVASKLDDIRSDAGTAVRRKSKRIRATGRSGSQTIIALASRARNVASSASDSIVTYTQKNPARALAVAAASGALLYAAIRALSPSRR